MSNSTVQAAARVDTETTEDGILEGYDDLREIINPKLDKILQGRYS